MSRQRLSDQQWRKHIEAYKRSGQSVARFCAVHGLAPSTFYLKKQEHAGPTRAINAHQPAAMFIELKADAQQGCDEATTAIHAASLDLLLPRGVTVRVCTGFDASLLRQVVEVLQ